MDSIKPSEALKQIHSNPELRNLYELTGQSLPNAAIQPYSIREYGEETGKYYDRPDYMGSVLDKIDSRDVKQYLISLIIGPSALPTDIAHEITHLYVHSILQYPIPWLPAVFWNIAENAAMFELASHIHTIVIHPLIDEILKKMNLFNPLIYKRILIDYRQELVQYVKNPLAIDKDYFLVKTIAAKNRLPPDTWEEIELEFGGRNSFKRLLNRLNHLPAVPEEITPDTVYGYVWKMWGEFRIDADKYRIGLCYDTPLLSERCNA